MKYCLLLLSLFVLSCAKHDSATSGPNDGSPAERRALTAFYRSLGGKEWTHNENWCTDAPLGNWYGVKVSDGAVVDLSLPKNGLTGILPVGIGELKRLIILDLSGNRIEGTIPDALYDLDALKYIDLESNRLTGGLSERVGGMENLESLFLSDNNLSGSLPASLFDMKRLVGFWGFNNEFSGAVPASVFDLPDPEYVRLMPQINGQQLYIACDDSNSQRHADGEVEVYRRASRGTGIDLVITGDGFTAANHALGGTAETMLKRQIDLFFEQDPYRSLQEYFNVYIVYAYSVSNGISYNGWWVDTRFRLVQEDAKQTVITYSDRLLEEFLASAGFSGEEYVVVISNSLNDVGVCYLDLKSDYSYISRSFVSLSNAAPYTFTHELGGHAIGLCYDEYSVSEDRVSPEEIAEIREQQERYGAWTNIDFTDDPQRILWSRLLSDARYSGLVGIYEGAYLGRYGVYRSTQNSIMCYSYLPDGAHFNAVCREIIYRRVMEKAYGPGWVYDYEEFVRFDTPNRLAPTSYRMPRAGVRKPYWLRPSAPPIFRRLDNGMEN